MKVLGVMLCFWIIFTSQSLACEMLLSFERTNPIENLSIKVGSYFGGTSDHLLFLKHVSNLVSGSVIQEYSFLLPPPFCRRTEFAMINYQCDYNEDSKEIMLRLSNKKSGKAGFYSLILNKICD